MHAELCYVPARCACPQDNVKPDERALWISQMSCLPCSRVGPLLYPRLLPLSRLLAEAADGNVTALDGNAYEGLTLSSESLQSGGVFLLENGCVAGGGKRPFRGGRGGRMLCFVITALGRGLVRAPEVA